VGAFLSLFVAPLFEDENKLKHEKEVLTILH
jgi:hypothetical protein